MHRISSPAPITAPNPSFLFEGLNNEAVALEVRLRRGSPERVVRGVNIDSQRVAVHGRMRAATDHPHGK